MRGWTACFVDTVSSSLLQNQVLNRLSDGFKLSVYKKAPVFHDIIGFHIFMFLDQSTFPFNGCKGKKKN